MISKLKQWIRSIKTKEEAKKYTEEQKPLTKAEATDKKQPWVAVLNTHVNPENIRNGFFELDWNEYFIVQLKSAGYVGDSEEAIVDLWFTELCRNLATESGINTDRRGMGYINITNIGGNRSEIS
jgi:hypothetical protein